MKNLKPAKIALFLTNIFFCLLIIAAITLPLMVTWYVETMGRSASLPTTILVTCYPCVPFTGTILLSLRRFLKDTIKGELFTPRNMKYLRNISICCVIIAIITHVAGKFYLPFFIVGGTFAFLGLLTYSLRGIFISQTENAAAQNNGK